jgi:hypothetical protein
VPRRSTGSNSNAITINSASDPGRRRVANAAQEDVRRRAAEIGKAARPDFHLRRTPLDVTGERVGCRLGGMSSLGVYGSVGGGSVTEASVLTNLGRHRRLISF